ncbi:MAG: DUF115 domain-containing protein [Desulfobacterales bacterium]|nr:DUF115 domain-containing protein [Desulfobacterales bacterium]
MGPWWEKNLSIAKKKNPNIINIINKEDSIKVSCFRSQSGDVVANAINKQTGVTSLLHDNNNPILEAISIADSLSLKTGEIRCIMGMGLGYLPLEIVKRKIPGHKLLIVEASVNIFKAGMEWLDLEAILNSDSVEIYLNQNIIFEEIIKQNQLAIYEHNLPINIYEPARILSPDFYTGKFEELSNARDALTISFNTLELDPVITHNFFNNFTEIIKSQNFSLLKNIMYNRPAIIIGAGPSLMDDLEALKKFGDRAFLIAVDSAAPILLKNGINPDIVVTVDFAEECFEKLRNTINYFENIPLLYLGGVYPFTPKLYPSPIKFFIYPPILFLKHMQSLWKGEWLEHLPVEGVAHLAFFIAIYSGASPIIFLGLDLAYTNSSSHAEGMAVPVSINLDKALWIEGIDGKYLPTMHQMMGMRVRLENLIKTSSVPCYNAGKRGAKILGARSCDLYQFLSQSKEQPHSTSKLIKDTFYNSQLPDLSKAISVLKKFKSYCWDASSCVEKNLKDAKKTSKALKEDLFGNSSPKPQTASLLKQLLNGQKKAVDAAHKVEVDERMIKKRIMDIQVEERHLELNAGKNSSWDNICKEVIIIEKYMEARIKALQELLNWTDRLIKRIEDEIRLNKSIKNVKSSSDKIKLLKELAKVYLDYGDPQLAEKILKEAISSNEKDPDILFLLIITLRKRLLYKESQDYLSKAISLGDKFNVDKISEYDKNWINKNLSLAKKHIDIVSSFINLPLAIIYCKDILTCYPNHDEAHKLLKEAEEKLNFYQNEPLKKANNIWDHAGKKI